MGGDIYLSTQGGLVALFLVLIGCSGTTNFDVQIELLHDDLLEHEAVSLRVADPDGGALVLTRSSLDGVVTSLWFGTDAARASWEYPAVAWLHDADSDDLFPPDGAPASDVTPIIGDRSPGGRPSTLSIDLP